MVSAFLRCATTTDYVGGAKKALAKKKTKKLLLVKKLQLLNEIVRDGNAALCEDALALAGENGRTDADSIRQCYYMIAKKEYRPAPLKLLFNAPALHYDPDLSAYDGLTGGEANG